MNDERAFFFGEGGDRVTVGWFDVALPTAPGVYAYQAYASPAGDAYGQELRDAGQARCHFRNPRGERVDFVARPADSVGAIRVADLRNEPVFYLDDDAVGFFRDGVPAAAGRYAYEAYRGPGHQRLLEELQRGGRVRCLAYDVAGRRIRLVVSALQPGHVDIASVRRVLSIGPWLF